MHGIAAGVKAKTRSYASRLNAFTRSFRAMAIDE
jgi:hypothetical protein